KYLMNVAGFVRDMKIGILIPVELNQEGMVLQLDECITCAGMHNIGKKICQFETGMVAGIVESHLNKRVKAHESKCNANGDGICEVEVVLNYA
ncbi:MAG: V4R domain-containing protein, partial [Aquificaceae bacterium]